MFSYLTYTRCEEKDLQPQPCNSLHFSSTVFFLLREKRTKDFTRLVWTVPRSLATTWGMRTLRFRLALREIEARDEISVPSFLFLQLLRCFSSLSALLLSILFNRSLSGILLTEFPHSDIPGSKVVCHLSETFRRLLRPSSACFVEPFTIHP